MDITDALGDVRRTDTHWELRYRRDLSHPPEKVWRAITESEHLEHWLPCDIVGERRAGAEVELPFWPSTIEAYSLDEGAGEAPVLPGRIEVWQPPEVFEWWWDTDRLRFELEPTPTGTRLSFTTWIPTAVTEAEDGPGPEQTAAGWHICLDELAESLTTGVTAKTPEPVVRALEARYRAEIEG